MADVSALLINALPIIKTLVWGSIIASVVIGGAYYFFIVQRRRQIKCVIWEEDAGQTFKATKRDTLVRKKTNKGKELYYMFKLARIETIPPKPEHIIRIGKKEEAHYLKTDDDTFIPLELSLILKEGKLNFIPMDYDVNILRIQAIDRRENMYKEKLGWLKEYQALIGALVVVGMIIVVVYLTFDWLTGVVNQVMGKVDHTASLLEQIINK